MAVNGDSLLPYCLPKGRHSEAAHEKDSFVPKNVPGVGRGGVGHIGVGWGGIGHVGVGWVGWGGVGWVM